MLRLIESSLATIEQHLVLVAPPRATFPSSLHNVTRDTSQNRQLIQEMQTLRGSIYLEEGNVKHQDLTDGRHQTAEDDESWHLLMTDAGRRVRSCVLYLEHENATSIQHSRLRHCPLVERAESRIRVTSAVESEMARARDSGLRFAEVGGWAITKERRGTPEGLMMALATYGLSRMLGGALVITTANVAHSCSSILRRLGGSYLECDGTPIPSYFDPRYNTEIDLLRFDSRSPSRKYAELIETVMDKLANVRIVGSSLDAKVHGFDTDRQVAQQEYAA